jgi:hypothetical protein
MEDGAKKSREIQHKTGNPSVSGGVKGMHLPGLAGTISKTLASGYLTGRVTELKRAADSLR